MSDQPVMPLEEVIFNLQALEQFYGRDESHDRDVMISALHHLEAGKRDEKVLQAAENMDWQQVVQNGGPPCFHLSENGRFCGRSLWWQGHTKDCHHRFVPLRELLEAKGGPP